MNKYERNIEEEEQRQFLQAWSAAYHNAHRNHRVIVYLWWMAVISAIIELVFW